MRASICVGNYCENPYCPEELGIRVYCLEELCYALKENAFLLDTGIMSERLVKWIDKECGVSQLAGELYSLVHKQGSLSAFVGMILEYVGLYDMETVRQVEETLKRGAGLSGLEKRKTQIDYLVRKKKYAAALRGYEILLQEWEDAKVIHNKGMALVGLMQYKQAADCFLQAYEADGSEVSFEAYLAAKRMELEEEDYISFAAELTEHVEDSLALEKKLEQLNQEWQNHPEYLHMQQRREWRQDERQKYYQDNERAMTALRNSYRSIAKG